MSRFFSMDVETHKLPGSLICRGDLLCTLHAFPKYLGCDVLVLVDNAVRIFRANAPKMERNYHICVGLARDKK